MEQKEKQRTYIAIDLKSFYASVECAERGLDPLDTNLVVADMSRTEKTICLAVSPSLKAHGVSGRARLFEVVQRTREVNAERLRRAPGGRFAGESYSAAELARDPSLALSYIVATPQMAHYIECSTNIYRVYLKYIAPEDIHVYSIDEVFIDATDYLTLYHMTAHELTMTLIRDVLRQTGITATAGIGTNLYLAKIAMDIVAKHIPPDADGVRIAALDEMSYRRQLWAHRPITDFWRVGRGYANKLAQHGLFTMGDVARCSLGGPGDFYNEALLYKLFGVNAELLIDHAWGWEPCRMADIKAYKPRASSLSSGQVLMRPYRFSEAATIVREMTDNMVLDLVDKGLVTDIMTLTINYDKDSLLDPEIRKAYHGPVTKDYYGRPTPKHAHGTANLGEFTSSSRLIADAVMDLYERIADPVLLIRRITLVCANVVSESALAEEKADEGEQLDLFTNYEEKEQREQTKREERAEERAMQEAVLNIQKKFGKNALVKGMDLQEEATGMDRNAQIGGHKA